MAKPVPTTVPMILFVSVLTHQAWHGTANRYGLGRSVRLADFRTVHRRSATTCPRTSRR